MKDIAQILLTLAKKRPLFHSEADFQHSLAWEIQRHKPAGLLRLEYPYSNKRKYLDILVKDQQALICIELKYKTEVYKESVDGEAFDLLYQGAQDIARYDFLKDIQRLEQYHGMTKGYAIFLTNDRKYWEPSRYLNTIDAEFRIHEGRFLQGSFSWAKRAGEGTIHGRKEKIRLKGKYTLHWEDYSEVDEKPNGKFRYLLIAI